MRAGAQVDVFLHLWRSTMAGTRTPTSAVETAGLNLPFGYALAVDICCLQARRAAKTQLCVMYKQVHKVKHATLLEAYCEEPGGDGGPLSEHGRR